MYVSVLFIYFFVFNLGTNPYVLVGVGISLFILCLVRVVKMNRAIRWGFRHQICLLRTKFYVLRQWLVITGGCYSHCRHDRSKAVDILVKDLKVFATFNEELYKEITQLLTLDNFRYLNFDVLFFFYYYNLTNAGFPNKLPFSSIKPTSTMNCLIKFQSFFVTLILKKYHCAIITKQPTLHCCMIIFLSVMLYNRFSSKPWLTYLCNWTPKKS